MTHNDPTTTFSLCTFGQLLLQRHRLAMTLHQSLVPDAPLWAYQAFLLAPAGPEARPTIDIRRASLDDPRAVPLVPRVTAIKALAALLRFAYLAELGKRKGVTVTERTTMTVGGKPATVFGFTTTTDQPDMLGCENPVVEDDNCWSLAVGVPTRVAAIDPGGAPVVVLTRTPEGNPDRVEWLGQFDGFLASMRFR